MDRTVQAKLAELLGRTTGGFQGAELTTNSALLDSLFQDHCPLHERETSLLVMLVELGAAREIQLWNEHQGPLPVLIERWVDALVRRRAIEAPAARWAVYCWVVGLGKAGVAEMDRALGVAPEPPKFPAKEAQKQPVQNGEQKPAEKAVEKPPEKPVQKLEKKPDPVPPKLVTTPLQNAQKVVVPPAPPAAKEESLLLKVGGVALGLIAVVVFLYLGFLVADWMNHEFKIPFGMAVLIIIGIGRFIGWLVERK